MTIDETGRVIDAIPGSRDAGPPARRRPCVRRPVCLAPTGAG